VRFGHGGSQCEPSRNGDGNGVGNGNGDGDDDDNDYDDRNDHTVSTLAVIFSCVEMV